MLPTKFRDGFGFGVMDFPNVCGSVPASPACGVCILRLISCAGAGGSCSDFLGRRLCLGGGLLDRGCGGMFDLLGGLCSDAEILSRCIPSLERRLWGMDFHMVRVYKDRQVDRGVTSIFINV